jgi:neutral ceramidase
MKASTLVVYLLSLAILLVVPSWSYAEAAGGLRAGAARIDITPEKPVQMSGYASRKDLSMGVHDPLSARVLAFETGGRRLVLVSTDLIGFYGGTAEVMRSALLAEFGLQPSELFLTAIHTHAGPTPTIDKERGHANNIEYTESLKGKLIEVVRQALDAVEPAGIGLGVGHSPIGVNRRELRVGNDGRSSIVLGRNPYGPTDKEVLVMKVASPEGKTRAVAFSYAVHATCLGPGNYTISGDVLGLAEQLAERVLGPEVIAPAFAGASGDIDPWFRVLPAFNTEPGWTPEPVLLGTLLGQEVVHVYRGIRQTAPTDRLATKIVTLELPAKPRENASDPKPGTVPFTITAARLGDVAFVGLSGEVLTEIGMAIKAGSPCRHTFIITHCNGASGYLAPKEAHVQEGYEVRSSRFAPQAADVVIREAIRLLHAL